MNFVPGGLILSVNSVFLLTTTSPFKYFFIEYLPKNTKYATNNNMLMKSLKKSMVTPWPGLYEWSEVLGNFSWV